jgi:hypothetical protein
LYPYFANSRWNGSKDSVMVSRTNSDAVSLTLNTHSAALRLEDSCIFAGLSYEYLIALPSRFETPAPTGADSPLSSAIVRT